MPHAPLFLTILVLGNALGVAWYLILEAGWEDSLSPWTSLPISCLVAAARWQVNQWAYHVNGGTAH
jgi:hypothetical protein